MENGKNIKKDNKMVNYKTNKSVEELAKHLGQDVQWVKDNVIIEHLSKKEDKKVIETKEDKFNSKVTKGDS